MRALIVNLFGAPGAGKSTGAAFIFSHLKMAGVRSELVTEFAKDKVWEDSTEVFRNQLYILAKQSFRISRCEDKVDVIVTDAPLLISGFYNSPSKRLGQGFMQMLLELVDSYDNYNVVIERVRPYDKIGRFQSEYEANRMGIDILDYLDELDVKYDRIPGDVEGYNNVVEKIKMAVNA